MNATDAMLTEPATVQGRSLAGDNAPDARPVPSFNYARVARAWPGTPPVTQARPTC